MKLNKVSKNKTQSPKYEHIKSKTNQFALTGIPEVDREILINLDIYSINNASITNVYIHNLLNNEFWRERLERKFNVITIDPNIDYKYINYILNDPNKYDEVFVNAINDGDLFLVKFMLDNDLIEDNFNTNDYITESSLKLALHTGNREMVKLVLQYYHEDFDSQTKLDLLDLFENTPDYQMIVDLPQMRGYAPPALPFIGGMSSLPYNWQ